MYKIDRRGGGRSKNCSLGLTPYIFTYTVLIWVFVCLFFVSNKRQNSLIKAKFVVGPRLTPRKVYG